MSGHNKTLVILTPGFAKDEADTTCIPMQQSFVRRLKQNYPHVNIIILAMEYPYSRSSYSWFGNFVRAFANRNRGGLPRLLLRHTVLKCLRKIHATNPIDGVLSFWYGECALAGKRFTHKYGIKHYCWMWGQDARKGNGFVKKTGLKADELIAFSDFLQDEVERNYTVRPQYVIPPGIDIKQFSPGSVRDIDIIAAGSLIPLKRYDLFIDVVAEIKKSIPSVKTVLIGSGPEKEKLEEMIRSQRLQSNIVLMGELPHHELLQWMQRGKLFLHTSSYEGFGVVCIEALCAGAVVISFVKPMNKEVRNWQIAGSKQQMINKAITILERPLVDTHPVVPYTIDETVRKMSELFSF